MDVTQHNPSEEEEAIRLRGRSDMLLYGGPVQLLNVYPVGVLRLGQHNAPVLGS
jgi:hypothetical protein